jgi:hypothetical protein
MKSLFLITLFLALAIRLYAPDHRVLYITVSDKIQPFQRIWDVICEYESGNNPLAFCIDINGLPSVGIAQIQESRLNDYNNQSGDNLTLAEMFNPEKARKVFMWFASKSKTNDSFIRSWNGSGPMAEIYLQNIKSHL